MFDFGLSLKNLREKSGLTQYQLAQKINRSKTVISKYENNLQTPTFETMVELALIFNVSLDYLAGIDKKNAVSVQGLSTEQESILQELSQMFRSKTRSAASGMSEKQLALINRIMVEFTKK